MQFKKRLIVLFLILPTVLSSFNFLLAQDGQMNEEEPIIITLMVVYTKQAKLDAEGRFGSIENAIAQGVSFTNNSLKNSKVNLKIELVHSAQVDYESEGNSRHDLRRLRSKEEEGEHGGYMLEVHEWRDKYKADLVKILTPGVGGLANLPRIMPDPAMGFSRTGVGDAGRHVFSHEIGHNLGLAHSRLQPAYSPSLQGGIFEYSTGWLWEPEEGNPYHTSDRFGSVMCVVNTKVAAPHFSNPDVKHRGKPTGTYEAEGGPADNARSLRETKRFFAGYRGSAFKEDSVAAAKLYESTNGDQWINNDGWKDRDLREWEDLHVAGAIFLMDLSSNRLKGEIPAEIGNLYELMELKLNDNSLSGSIPSSIGNLEKLEKLELNHNNLTGKIPPEIGNLKSIDWLYLHENNLSGAIPSEIGNIQNITRLYLSDNDLSGEIPAEIGNIGFRENRNYHGDIENRGELILRNNNLSGDIPKEIGSLENLQRIHLQNNNLSGEIPPEIGNVTGLTDLWLYQNNLAGPIPMEITNLNLSGFSFFSTKLCKPSNNEFQTWFNSISYALGTDVYCDDVVPDVVRLNFPINENESIAPAVEFNWQASNLADSYHFQLSTDESFNEVYYEEVIDNPLELDQESNAEINLQINNLDGNKEYFWRVRATNDFFEKEWWNEWSRVSSFKTSDVTSAQPEEVPEDYSLKQNYPNPFNPSTRIRFAIPEQVHVRLTVYNMLGQQVGTLLNETRSAGWHDVSFDASGLSSGMFIYRIEAGEHIETRQMLFVK